MPSEKEKPVLKSQDYEIGGNTLRAFYDARGKLVFVLDYYTSDIKPNVLLVMTSHGDRKWDDVLANEYGVDLETVRPKKDNKYQKLDVEYDGLVVYDNLIRAYTDDGDVDAALRDLNEFRTASCRRAAMERLDVARAVAENARETIDRAGDSIVELQAKIKTTRAKLQSLRRNIGREPTKQSAAKILKTEARLEMLNSKLNRAKRRLENATKRLDAANDDMAAAQRVLDLIPDNGNMNRKFKTVETKRPAPEKKLPVVAPDDEPMDDDAGDDASDDEFDDDDNWIVDDDADDNAPESNDDVKPLFDKDPNIMDEKIAFKPINFDESWAASTTDAAVVRDNDIENNDASAINFDDQDLYDDTPVADENSHDDKPVADEKSAFVPPKPIMDVVRVPDGYDTEPQEKLDNVFSESVNDTIDYGAPVATDAVSDENKSDNAPVLDSLTNVDDVPAPTTDTAVDVSPRPVDDMISPTNYMVPENTTNMDNADNDVVVPDTPDVPNVPDMSAIADVNESNDNNNDENKVDNNIVIPAPVVDNRHADNVVRPMSPGARPVVATTPVARNNNQRPSLLYYVLLLVLIALSVFTLWLYQRSNVSPDAVPELVADNAPVVMSQDEIENTDVADENPFVAIGDEAKTVDASVIEGAVENSLNKIVAAADIEPEPAVVEPEPEPVVAEPEPYVEPQEIVEPQPTVVNKPEYKVTQENVFVGSGGGVNGNLCDGDVAPDANGCCPGETYSLVNNQRVCCPDVGGDCFPPLF